VKVLHATGWYPPHSIGGTEVYLQGLVRELSHLGVSSSVIVPAQQGRAGSYLHDGVEVLTYSAPIPGRRARRLEDPGDDLESFEAALHRGFDIYHQHSWTRGCGAAHLRAARAAGLRTVMTVHTPNATCMSGSMMRNGRVQCEGRIDDRICSACWAVDRGAPAPAAAAMALIPRMVAGAATTLSTGQLPRPAARALTLMGARAHTASKAREFVSLVEDAEHLVAVCGWIEHALLANGAAPERLTLSRQGVDTDLVTELQSVVRHRSLTEDPIVFGLIGRWDAIKGCHVAIEAFRRLGPNFNSRLELHGTPQGEDGAAYLEQCRKAAAGDPRIFIGDAFTRAELPALLSRFDALLVPSQWMETGPLVVLEAQAARIWVIGSRMGGIAELVSDGETGNLVPHNDVAAWSNAMARFVRAPLSPEWRKPRTMADAADDMSTLYHKLLPRSNS
jgi:glycosyltransferase involved in cell wall biosynthesis